jgi:hypothetical protein
MNGNFHACVSKIVAAGATKGAPLRLPFFFILLTSSLDVSLLVTPYLDVLGYKPEDYTMKKVVGSKFRSWYPWATPDKNCTA